MRPDKQSFKLSIIASSHIIIGFVDGIGVTATHVVAIII